MEIDFQNRAETDSKNVVYPYAEMKTLSALGPVVWNDLLKGWMITNYSDIKKVLADSKNFSNEDGNIREAFGKNAFLFIDTSMHNTLRSIWSKQCAANTVEDYYPVLSQIAQEVLAPARQKWANGESVEIVDVLKNYMILGITTLMDIKTDRLDDFKRWNRDIFDAPQLKMPKDDPRYIKREQAKAEVFEFLRPAVEDRVRRLANGEQVNDLIAPMVLAESVKGIDRATVLDNLLNLFLGAFDTSVLWLGNIISVLGRNLELLTRLLNDPAHRAKAYEEIMRHETVVQTLERVVRNDGASIAGHPFAKGDSVYLMLGLGNRDPSIFTNPDQLDINRSQNLNIHLGFGFGMHQCLGAYVGRIEVRAFMDQFFNDFPNLEIWETDYGPNWSTWGPTAMHLRSRSCSDQRATL